MQKILLCLGVLLACVQGTVKTPALPADQNAKQVLRIWKNPDANQWRRSKWFNRYTDTGTPAWVVISVGDYACVLENGVVDEPNRLDWFACPVAWRNPTANYED